jgi:hypothetical protein
LLTVSAHSQKAPNAAREGGDDYSGKKGLETEAHFGVLSGVFESERARRAWDGERVRNGGDGTWVVPLLHARTKETTFGSPIAPRDNGIPSLRERVRGAGAAIRWPGCLLILKQVSHEREKGSLLPPPFAHGRENAGIDPPFPNAPEGSENIVLATTLEFQRR